MCHTCNGDTTPRAIRMDDGIFREYDIRGKVGSEFFIGQAYDLTRAIAYYFMQHNPDVHTIALGMDGRLHSAAIKDEVCRALTDSGINVIFIGTCPSPVLYYALHTLSVQGGLMITASHNPKEYNGLKICLGTKVIWGKELKVIRDFYKEKKQVVARQQGMQITKSVIDSYVYYLANQFASLKNSDFSAVIDCGNGAAGTVLPLLVEQMGWSQVHLLYPEVDGSYPNHEADPVVEKNMQDVKRLLQTTASGVGVGLDGDCDRMAAMTKKGILVPGDELLALFAQPILAQHAGGAVVLDVKSSAGLIEVIECWGGKPVLSPSGHAIIKDQMQQHNAVLGGELSCHFFFNDRYFGYDDGIYAMMRLFELLLQRGKSLDELLTVFPTKYSTREFRLSCKEEQKQIIIDAIKQAFKARSDATLITIDGVRATFPYGWGIVRASNTQAVLCIRFESDSASGLERVKHDFIPLLQPYFNESLEKTFTD